MKKFFICLFSVLSVFIVISCFISRGRNQPDMSFQVVLKELKNSHISFDIENDINEVATSLNDLDLNTTFKSGDILKCIEGIGKTIYYGARFLIKLIVHTLVCALNIIILVLRCIGFTTMQYIHFRYNTTYIDNNGVIHNPNNPFESGNRGMLD